MAAADSQNLLLKLLVCGIIALAVGAIFGYMLKAPEVKEVPKEVIKEVEKLVEVEKQVEVLVPADKDDLLKKAVDEFVLQLEDNDLLVCDDVEYDEDQVSVVKSYSDFAVEYTKDTEEIFATVKLKYLDKDTEEKCYVTYDFSVLYEEDEDPFVSLVA